MEQHNNNQKEVDKRIAIESSKHISKNRALAQFKECFHHKDDECKGPIVRAHSLQENGKLSLLEAPVNGQNKIYSFSEIISNSQKYVGALKPTGKSTASTFFGFYSYHDTDLFKPIELLPYDENNEEQNFLHSYRSFAFSQHAHNGDARLLSVKSEKDSFDDLYLEGVLLGIQDGEKLRKELNTILDNKTYGNLYYHTRVFENTRSIAVSSVITPSFFYDNNPFNNHDNPSISYSNIMLTIFPSEKYTNVILACSKQDKLGIKFLNQLRVLSKLKFQKAVSSIIVGNVENTFLSPIFWNALGKKKQDILLKELSFCIMETFHPFMSHQSFFHSKINFFDPIYSASNL